jgi:hypothetical protein
MKSVSLKYILLLPLLFLILTTQESTAQKEKAFVAETAKLNSDHNTVFLFQSYLLIDYIQRETYICHGIDSTYRSAAISNIRESYRIMASDMVELEKLCPEKHPAKEEIQNYISILQILKEDIDLLEKYTLTKQEKDYDLFLKNHKMLWKKLDKLKSNSALKPLKQ